MPDPRIREERELARRRLYLFKHKSALNTRVHSTLINFRKRCPVTDLFGVEGRELLARLQVPERWRGNITSSVELIDDLEAEIAEINRRLKQGHAKQLHTALDERAGDWLGIRLHERRGDRPGRALPLSREADRLHVWLLPRQAP